MGRVDLAGIPRRARREVVRPRRAGGPGERLHAGMACPAAPGTPHDHRYVATGRVPGRPWRNRPRAPLTDRRARRRLVLGPHDPAPASHDGGGSAAPAREPAASLPLGRAAARPSRARSPAHATGAGPSDARSAHAAAGRLADLRGVPLGVASAAPLRGGAGARGGPHSGAPDLLRELPDLLVADRPARTPTPSTSPSRVRDPLSRGGHGA